MCGAQGRGVRTCVWDHYSLCFRDEFVSVIPVSQEIRCLFIIYPNVVILKDSWEEVIYLSSDIQDISHPVRKPTENMSPATQAKSNSQHCFSYLKLAYSWASLVAPWLRTRLPMQGTRVRALVWEDPACREANKLMRHNY